MKKIILTFAAVIITSASFAQVGNGSFWGVKAGASFSNHSIGVCEISPRIQFGMKTGFYVGATYNYNFTEHWGVQTELTYNYEGSTISANLKDYLSKDEVEVPVPVAKSSEMDLFSKHLKVSVNQHIIRVPVMAKFRVEGLSVMAGPYVALRVGSGINYNKNIKNLLTEFQAKEPIDDLVGQGESFYNTNFKKFDFGAAFGIEYAFKNGIYVDVQYNLSLLNSIKKDLDLSAFTEGEEFKLNVSELVGFTPVSKKHVIKAGIGFRF